MTGKLARSGPTNNRISVAIMTHPRRRDQAKRLLGRLEEFDARLVEDPDPGGPPSALRTAIEAWRACPEWATHHVILQDDATIPHEHFRRLLLQAISARPDEVFTLFTSWTCRTGQAARMAALTGASWVPIIERSVKGVGVVLPASYIPDLLAFAKRSAEVRDSGVLYEFLRSHGKSTMTVVPSLVQHDVPWQPSIWSMNVDQGPRRSAVYTEGNFDGISIGLDELQLSHLPYIPNNETSAAWAAIDQSGLVSSVSPLRAQIAQTGESLESFSQLYASSADEAIVAHSPMLSNAYLYQVWSTAFFMGFELGAEVRRPLIGRAQAVSACRTLLAGPLRNVLPDAALRKIAASDVTWLLRAIDLGARRR
jgi:hypothetical protein